MKRGIAYGTAMPLLIAFGLVLSACSGGPDAYNRASYDGRDLSDWSGGGWHHGFVRHVSWDDGGGHGFAGHGDFGGPGDGRQDGGPAYNLVSLAPPPFTAVYSTSLGQAYNTLERYYEAHASERAGQCRAPYIDGITNTQVVENTPERLMVEVRYLYRDRIKQDAAASCIGYGARRFVLARNSHDLGVEEMSGPARN